MHLLQLSQSIDSPSVIYVAFQWDPLLWPSLPPPQEGHSDTRVLGQMPSDPLQCTYVSKSHIHCHYRTISLDLIEAPHTKPESPASFALLLEVFFFFFFNSINNGKCKSPKQMFREKKMVEREPRTIKRRGNRKNTSEEQNNPAGPPLPLETSEVTLWGYVWTKRSLKLGYSTVLWHHYGHY